MHTVTRRKFRGRDRTLARDLIADLQQAIHRYDAVALNGQVQPGRAALLGNSLTYVKAQDLVAALQADLAATVTIQAF